MRKWGHNNDQIENEEYHFGRQRHFEFQQLFQLVLLVGPLREQRGIRNEKRKEKGKGRKRERERKGKKKKYLFDL